MKIVILLLATAGVLGTLAAQNNVVIKKVPLKPTSPSSGSEMFGAYCAPCHGRDGRGSGPAAPALKSVPADLTHLAAQNQGKFPDDKMFLLLTTPRDIAAHGSEEMPVWGDLLKSLQPGRNELAQLRATNLISYLKSIQAK